MSGQSSIATLRALATTAMIGTDRAGAKPAELLRGAAVHGVRARAGWQGPRVSGAVERCPEDSTPPARPAAAATLARLLASPDAALIEEWAALAVQARVRVPDGLVPLVLAWWCQSHSREAAVIAACGVRGQWLASLNPDWRQPISQTMPADAEAQWQTGTAAERAALLATVRRHDPARGLALVRGTWASDAASQRQRCLEIMRETLVLADEPLLEQALDDKSKLVRGAAQLSLCFLQGSALRARMSERLRAMITIERKRGSVAIRLRPPAELDAAAVRDGVGEATEKGKGVRAQWMRNIIRGADRSVWIELSGLDPAGVLDGIAGDDYAEEAYEALMTAAAGDRAWAAAALDVLPRRVKWEWQRLGLLWGGMGKADNEAVLLHAFARLKPGPLERWMMLASLETPWSAVFTARAADLARSKRAVRSDNVWQLRGSLESIVQHAHPVHAEELAAAVAESVPEDDLGQLRVPLDRLRLRADMHKEFAL